MPVDNSILKKPFLVLSGLLLLALVVQFSIMFVWFDRGHYEAHDTLGISRGKSSDDIHPSIEVNIPKLNDAAAVEAVHSRLQQKSSLTRSEHEGDFSLSGGHNNNINRTAQLAEVKTVAVQPDPPKHGTSEGKHNQVVALRRPNRTAELAKVKASAVQPDPPKHGTLKESKKNQNQIVARHRQEQYLDYEVNKNKTEVLNAVIHIGPYKTATTTIQTYSGELVNFLAQDHYEMPWSFLQKEISKGNGKKYKIKKVASWWRKQTVFATCFFQNVPQNRMHDESPDMCERDIYDAGIEIVQRNKNSLLVSAEQFSNTEHEGVEALQEYLLNRWDNVTIVATYRRYYEWIVSFYNERYKHHNLYDVAHANETDRLFPSLYHELLLNHDFNDAIQHAYTLSAVARFKKHFRNVVVMNYHDKSKSLPERFYCDVVPNAHNTCRRLKSRKTNKKVNTSHNRIYEELAYHAHRRGRITIQSKKKAKLAEASMHQHQEKTLNLTSDDFPRKCLPEHILQDIWSISIEAEKEFGSDNDGDSMKNEFDKYSKTSFCEVDLDAVLDSPPWVEFLKGFK